MLLQNLRIMFGASTEDKTHPHVVEERAHLYHSIDDGQSTEFEVLHFLNALIICFKPRRIIETGTAYGFGTIAIVDALINNGFGFLHSLDCNSNRIKQARGNLKKYFKKQKTYQQHHQIIQQHSFDFIDNYRAKTDADKFDLGFFDSSLVDRSSEFKMMAKRGILNKNFLAIFHDTSRLRSLSMPDHHCPEMIKELDQLSQGNEWLEFPYSRGFRILKYNP
jgi:predicted O-methyltransferase YrrM